MTTKELIKQIAKRTGIPENIVRKSVLDFSKDCQSVISNKITGSFDIPNIGYFSVLIPNTMGHMQTIVRNLEVTCEKKKHLFGTENFTRAIGAVIDNFFACASMILENNLIKNENYNTGAGKKRDFDKDTYNECMQRMAVILSKIPLNTRRKEYTEIQKILMRRLRKQGILQSRDSKIIKV